MAVLVLNSSLQPLSVIPERRLIVLLSKQKVTFVDDNVRQLIEESIQARRLELERPVIVQLLANVRIPRMALQPTRSNILLRDEETCQYCGKRSREQVARQLWNISFRNRHDDHFSTPGRFGNRDGLCAGLCGQFSETEGLVNWPLKHHARGR